MADLPLDALRCPATGRTLTLQGGQLITDDGSRRYRFVGEVPILVDEAFSVFGVRDIVDGAFVESRPTLARRIIRALTPSRDVPGRQRDRFEAFVERVVADSPARRPRVLVVGGGTLGLGAEPLVETAAIELVETDVFISKRTAIVCDGHHLPFADGTFDGVVIQAVLEHVLDPVRVVAEIHRVLVPNGVVYAETPFMQQVHEGQYDFTRWTETGHRRLFRMFTEIETGVVAGPATALLWSVCYFARSVPSRRSLAPVAERLALYLFFWLKYLDRFVIDHEAATDGASGVYFTGRRSEAPVSDADVLDAYRGAIGRPVRDG